MVFGKILFKTKTRVSNIMKEMERPLWIKVNNDCRVECHLLHVGGPRQKDHKIVSCHTQARVIWKCCSPWWSAARPRILNLHRQDHQQGTHSPKLKTLLADIMTRPFTQSLCIKSPCFPDGLSDINLCLYTGTIYVEQKG